MRAQLVLAGVYITLTSALYTDPEDHWPTLSSSSSYFSGAKPAIPSCCPTLHAHQPRSENRAPSAFLASHIERSVNIHTIPSIILALQETHLHFTLPVRHALVDNYRRRKARISVWRHSLYTISSRETEITSHPCHFERDPSQRLLHTRLHAEPQPQEMSMLLVIVSSIKWLRALRRCSVLPTLHRTIP